MRYRKLFFILLLYPWVALAQNSDEQLARQFLQHGEFVKAADLYSQLFKASKDPAQFDAYLKCLKALNKTDEAEKAAKKQVKENPGVIDFKLSLAKIYRDKGEQKNADAVYNNLLKDLPADKMRIYDLATRFYQSDNVDFAVKIFQQGRKLLNNPDEFSLELVNLYRYKKDKFGMADEYMHLLSTKPEYLYHAQNNLAIQFDSDKDYDLLKSALLKQIQKNPEQTVFTEMLGWVYIRQKQYDQALNQTLSLARRQKDDGEKVFKLGRLLMDNDAYETAARAFDYVIKLGPESQWYVPAKVEALDARSKMAEKGMAKQADLLALEQEYLQLLKEFGKTPNTAFAMQRLATLQATRLNNSKKAEATLEELIAIRGLNPNMLADAKLDLGDYYLFDNQPWEATLVYSQVEKAFPGQNAGQEAKFRNARLAFYTGEFSFAKSQFDVLKASTSQLIANDALNMSLLIGDNLNADSTGAALKVYARADLHIAKKNYEKARLTLDSINRNFPNSALDDDVLMARSKIFIEEKQYAKAAETLNAIVANHSFGHWADDALFLLGDVYENKLNDKAKAMASFEKIITAYPSSLWVNEARKRFRTLRGDEPPAGS